jgi:hypothetical protein
MVATQCILAAWCAVTRYLRLQFRFRVCLSTMRVVAPQLGYIAITPASSTRVCMSRQPAAHGIHVALPCLFISDGLEILLLPLTHPPCRAAVLSFRFSTQMALFGEHQLRLRSCSCSFRCNCTVPPVCATCCVRPPTNGINRGEYIGIPPLPMVKPRSLCMYVNQAMGA